MEEAVEQFADNARVDKPPGLGALLAEGFCLGAAGLAMTEARI